MSIFAHFGITLPHSSDAQYSAPGGTVISTNINDVSSMALPGDLLVWHGHVSIYIGNNQMVHARGKKYGIVVTNITSEHPFKGIVRYWK